METVLPASHRSLDSRPAAARPWRLAALALAASLIVPAYVGTVSEADALPPASMRFADMPQAIGRGLAFVPVVRVLLLDAAGNPPSPPVTVRLAILGSPAGVRLANGPGQSEGSPWPQAVTNAAGIASFPGLTVVADSATFKGGSYRLVATSGSLSAQSDLFFVGRTSPGWHQYQSNALRNGWGAGTADFSTRSLMQRVAFPGGDVDTNPVVIDLDLDGVDDIVAVNSGTGRPSVVRAYNGATWAPMWSYTILVSGACSGTNCAQSSNYNGASLAAGYFNGRAVVLVNYELEAQTAAAAATWSGLVALNGATGITLTGAPIANNPTYGGYPLIAPAIGDIGAGGAQDIVVPVRSGAATWLRAYRISPTNTISTLWVQPATTQYMWPGSVAIGELRSDHAGNEVVLAGAHYYVVDGYVDGGLRVCRPTAFGSGCTEGLNFGTVAPVGVSLGDLDADGRLEIVMNGIDDPQFGSPTLAQTLSVFKGNAPAVSSPGAWLSLPVTSEGDLQHSAALGDIDGQGRLDIVNVQSGEGPPGQPPERQRETGDVLVRGLDAAGLAIQDQGVWTRGGSTNDPKESPGGGILFDVDGDDRPEFIFGSKDGKVTATKVTGAPLPGVPGPSWSMGNLGSLSASDATQGVPLSSLALGDFTGDCRAEIVSGLSGGASQSGEVAVLRGVDARAPGVPSFTEPIDYTDPQNWPGAATNVPPTFSNGAYGTSPGGDYPNPVPQAKLAWNAPRVVQSVPWSDIDDGGLPIVEYKVWRATDSAFTEGVKYVGSWPSGTPPTPANPFIDHSSNPHVVNPVDAEALSASSAFYYKVAAVTCYTLSRDPASYGLPPASRLSAQGVLSEVSLPAGPTGAVTAVGYGDPAYLASPGTAAVKLSWPAAMAQDAAKPEGCAWNWGYNVQRRQLPAGPYVDVGSPVTAPHQATGTVTYIDVGVPKGFEYVYRIRTVNCVGPSVDAIQTGTVDLRLPTAPTGLAITGGAASLTLTWSPPASLRGCTAPGQANGWVEGYRIYRGTSSGAATLHATLLPPGSGSNPPWRGLVGAPSSTDPAPPPGSAPLTFTDTGLAPGGTYYYQVAAVTCVGEGARSPEATLTLGSVPPLAASLAPATQKGTTVDTFFLQPVVGGGLAPVSCTWSLSPPTAMLAAPTGATSCSQGATLSGAQPGTYTVTLVATDSDTPATTLSATATIEVRYNLPPVARFAATAQAQPGDAVTFDDLSQDPDGSIASYLWEFGDGASSSVAEPAHAYAKAGQYLVRLTVFDNDGATDSFEQEVAVEFGLDRLHALEDQTEAVTPASAHAGPDVAVLEGERVSLLGIGPADLTYAWRQADGPPVVLTGADTLSPSFVAPRLASDAPLALRFVLEAANGRGVKAYDTVDVVVRSANSPPVADAGASLEAPEGTVVRLDATASADADGDALAFEWTQVAGPAVELHDASGPTPTFTVPPWSAARSLAFRVQVSDARSANADAVWIVVLPGATAGAAGDGGAARMAPDESRQAPSRGLDAQPAQGPAGLLAMMAVALAVAGVAAKLTLAVSGRNERQDRGR